MRRIYTVMQTIPICCEGNDEIPRIDEQPKGLNRSYRITSPVSAIVGVSLLV